MRKESEHNSELASFDGGAGRTDQLGEIEVQDSECPHGFVLVLQNI
jgi:hypothetical protein